MPELPSLNSYFITRSQSPEEVVNAKRAFGHSVLCEASSGSAALGFTADFIGISVLHRLQLGYLQGYHTLHVMYFCTSALYTFTCLFSSDWAIGLLHLALYACTPPVQMPLVFHYCI